MSTSGQHEQPRKAPPSGYSILESEADLRPGAFQAARSSTEDLPPAAPKARKRVFVGLICGTTLIICLLLTLGWVIPNRGLANIHPSLPYVTGALVGFLFLLIAWMSIALVLQVLTGHPSPKNSKTWGLTVKLFVPLLELVGRIVGITPMDVRRSFIQVNNKLVHASKGSFKPEEILLLLPHCLQWSECSLRVSNNLERCKRCGRCDLAALLDLTGRYGVNIAIATGGTIARRIVVEKRPKLILAIACERDLTSGIQDTHPLPVYGILNQRPEGPCLNTRVVLDQVEDSLKHFIRQ